MTHGNEGQQHDVARFSLYSDIFKLQKTTRQPLVLRLLTSSVYVLCYDLLEKHLRKQWDEHANGL